MTRPEYWWRRWRARHHAWKADVNQYQHPSEDNQYLQVLAWRHYYNSRANQP